MKKEFIFSIFFIVIVILITSCHSGAPSTRETVSVVYNTTVPDFPTAYPTTREIELTQGEDGIVEVELIVSAPFSIARIILHEDGAMNYEASSSYTGIGKEVDSSAISE